MSNLRNCCSVLLCHGDYLTNRSMLGGCGIRSRLKKEALTICHNPIILHKGIPIDAIILGVR